jgi:hypothetical protein
MTIVYKVLNPSDGSYSSHATMEECYAQIIKVAYAFYVLHTHSIPFSIVDQKIDGTQVWRTPDGKDMPSPDDALKMMSDAFSPEFQQMLAKYNES